MLPPYCQPPSVCCHRPRAPDPPLLPLPSDLLLGLQESWRQYEEGASRFVEELSSILAKEDQQQPDEAGRAGAGAHAAAALQGEDPRAHRSHQLMKALAVMEDHVAASLDPEKLTGALP